MRQIIVGNWKMYLARERGIELVRELAAAAPALDCDLVVCPPFPMIHPLALALEGSAIAVGGRIAIRRSRGRLPAMLRRRC